MLSWKKKRSNIQVRAGKKKQLRMFAELQSTLVSNCNMHLNMDVEDQHRSLIFLPLRWDFQRHWAELGIQISTFFFFFWGFLLLIHSYFWKSCLWYVIASVSLPLTWTELLCRSRGMCVEISYLYLYSNYNTSSKLSLNMLILKLQSNFLLPHKSAVKFNYLLTCK